MSKVFCLMFFSGLMAVLSSGCGSNNSDSELLGKKETATASIQFAQPATAGRGAKSETGFLKVRLTSEYLRTLEHNTAFDYPGDSCVYFLSGTQKLFPGFIQYINSGRPDEFHYLVDMSMLEKNKGMVLKTNFGVTAIDSLFTPLNF